MIYAMTLNSTLFVAVSYFFLNSKKVMSMMYGFTPTLLTYKQFHGCSPVSKCYQIFIQFIIGNKNIFSYQNRSNKIYEQLRSSVRHCPDRFQGRIYAVLLEIYHLENFWGRVSRNVHVTMLV